MRLNAGLYPGDLDIAAVVEHMLEQSAEFRDLWDDNDVSSLTRAFKIFAHPELGRIELTYQTFEVHDAPGQQLLVGTAKPGSASADALAILSAMQSAGT